MACLGLVRTALASPGAPVGASALEGSVRRIQNELVNVGSDLATLPADRHPQRPRVTERHVEALEHEMDAWNEGLPALRSFILPGGGLVASYLHLARTVCRRAERPVVGLAAEEHASSQNQRYLHQHTDTLLVKSRPTHPI